MGKRTKLSINEMLRVMRHLADVSALKGNVPAQRQLLIDGLIRLVGANQGFFLVANDWLPRANPTWSHFTLSTDLDPVALKYMAELGTHFPITADPYCAGSLVDSSPIVSISRQQATAGSQADAAFAAFRDVDRTVRATDGLVSFSRNGPDGGRIVGFAMHRFGGGERKITPIEAAMLRFAVAETKSLVDRGHLALPPMDATDPLPPRLGQVLDLLLAGQPPKRIAVRLGLSLHTVREHITRLYRHFGVSGRDELAARFIR